VRSSPSSCLMGGKVNLVQLERVDNVSVKYMNDT
jgi:hypothetical protein